MREEGLETLMLTPVANEGPQLPRGRSRDDPRFRARQIEVRRQRRPDDADAAGEDPLIRRTCARVERVNTCTDICDDPVCRVHAWYVDGRASGPVIRASQTHVLDD
jgi:hypothetical protein